jgi:transmembrane sensor
MNGHGPARPRAASTRIEAAAADWLARREAGLSPDEQADFSRWLLADGRHAAAVAELESAWRRLHQPRLAGQAATLARAVEARVRRRNGTSRRLTLTLGAALAAAAAVILAFRPGNPGGATDTATQALVLRPERRSLPDGSVVELDAGAGIEVAYSAEQRSVRLIRGEAHFSVARDPRRPFVVAAGLIAVRAVGTEFAVQLHPGSVGVLVTEGRVAVEHGPAPDPVAAPAVTYLEAGDRLTVPTRTSTPPAVVRYTPAERQAALAWRGLRVEFSDTPLSEAIALFNRHNRVQLSLAHEDLARIRISGSFPADDPEGFSRLLEASAGLRADRATPGRIGFTR